MRLFFALWPPPAAAEQLAALTQSCARRYGGQPTRPETLHLTLAFLGEVAAERVPQLIETAKATPCAPFAVRIDRLGYWQQRRLLWAGCATAAPQLGELADTLRRALAATGYAVASEPGAYTPHITLVRRIAETAEALGQDIATPIAWRCRGFSLIESRRSNDGPTYTSVFEFPATA